MLQILFGFFVNIIFQSKNFNRPHHYTNEGQIMFTFYLTK